MLSFCFLESATYFVVFLWIWILVHNCANNQGCWLVSVWMASWNLNQFQFCFLNKMWYICYWDCLDWFHIKLCNRGINCIVFLFICMYFVVVTDSNFNPFWQRNSIEFDQEVKKAQARMNLKIYKSLLHPSSFIPAFVRDIRKIFLERKNAIKDGCSTVGCKWMGWDRMEIFEC